jgi:hypothetical protein
MHKFTTIISLLFIVAAANCMKKVSYSEIVSSLMQVTHVEGGAEIVDSISANYKESMKVLLAYDNQVSNQCTTITERANKKLEEAQNVLEGGIKSIQEFEASSKALAVEINEEQDGQEGNKNNAERLRSELVDDREKLQAKTIAIIERARVLQRLSNIVADELVGKQRDSTVGNFKIDNAASGYSFIQVHNQLKELNTHDPMVKSMIAALIMITQDQKNLFANQGAVSKIQAMINDIIKKDAITGQKLREAASEKVNTIQKTLSVLADTMMHTMDTLAEKKAKIVQNTNLINYLRTEQKGIEKYILRAKKRAESNLSICTNVEKLNKLHTADFQLGVSKFDELKKVLS